MRIAKFATVATVAAALTIAALQPAAAKTRIFPLKPNAAVFLVFASVGTVILNAIIVSATQCRELTQEEALTAIGLPVVGLAINSTRANASKCGKPVATYVKVKG